MFKKHLNLKINPVGKTTFNFMETLFTTVFTRVGRLNFLNMSRYSSYSDRSIRRHYSKGFDWLSYNFQLIDNILSDKDECVGAIDASYIPKSGKKTWGLDKFWSGCQSKSIKGIEISSIGIVIKKYNSCFTLSVRQTPSGTELGSSTRIDHYVDQLERVISKLKRFTKYIAADGFYAKKKFVDACNSNGMEIICKLRSDANLKFIYQGQHEKRKGRRKRYDGKVNFDQLDRFDFVGSLDESTDLYTKLVYSVSLKRNIRIALLINTKRKGYCVLFSSDALIKAKQIVAYYKMRYQIEFTFRDAKQHTGLNHCQSRDRQRLDFHFNVSLTAVNIAKVEIIERDPNRRPEKFSLDDFKRNLYNIEQVHRFIDLFELKPRKIIEHPAYQSIINYGRLVA